MRTVGLLGGMSWESSALYYRLLNEGVRDRLGGLHSARCVLLSVDFADVEVLQQQGRWDDAGALLADAARSLEAAGADLLLLCTNTMHKVAAALQEAVGVPLLHIGDSTADAALVAGHRRVALLGTAFTMEQPFLREHLEARGLEVLVPGAEDRALVHRTIYDELCQGVVLESSRQACREVLGRLAAQGVDAVVLGCTELELLLAEGDSPVPLLPTTRLHVEAALERALA